MRVARLTAGGSIRCRQLPYDANGNVLTLRQRDGGVIGYSYDALDRRTLMDLAPGGINDDVAYSYDLLGRMLSANGQQSGHYATFAYDALGRVVQEGDVFRPKSHAWDLAGRQTRMTYGDGFYVDYDYDVTGNVTAIRENGATSGAGVLATYSYDDLGRRTGVTRGNGTTSSYTYDPVSRLASLGHNLAGTAADVTTTFAYNPASQIVTRTGSNDAYAWTSHFNKDVAETPNGLNQLVQQGAAALSFDARGNTIAIGPESYTYTQLNQLSGKAGSSYLFHDPLGRVDYISPGPLDANATFIVSEGLTRIFEQQNGVIARRYVHAPGVDEPVVWYEGGGTSDRRWLHADERGSIVAVSDGAGNAMAINRYDEYGTPAPTNVGKFGYTGQLWIAELGIWDYKARAMNPKTGRFMQTDPIGYAAGMNLYAYVSGDPVNKVDPLGLAEYCYETQDRGYVYGDTVVGGRSAQCATTTTIKAVEAGAVVAVVVAVVVVRRAKTSRRSSLPPKSAATYSVRSVAFLELLKGGLCRFVRQAMTHMRLVPAAHWRLFSASKLRHRLGSPIREVDRLCGAASFSVVRKLAERLVSGLMRARAHRYQKGRIEERSAV